MTTSWDAVTRRAPGLSHEQILALDRDLKLPDHDRRVTWIEGHDEHPWWFMGEDEGPQPWLGLVRCLRLRVGELLRVPRSSAWEREGFPRLVRLELLGATDASRLRRALWRLPGVIELDLSNALQVDTAADVVEALPPVRHLELRFIGPPPGVLEGLRRSEAARELRHLDLSGNSAVGEQSESLAGLPLRSLVLAGARIDEVGLRRLLEGPMTRTLEHLDLRGVTLPPGIRLADSSKLRTLVLSPGVAVSDVEHLEITRGSTPTNTSERRTLPAAVTSMIRADWTGRRLPWSDPACAWWDPDLHGFARGLDEGVRVERLAASCEGVLEIVKKSPVVLADVRHWLILPGFGPEGLRSSAPHIPRLETIVLSEYLTSKRNALLGQLPELQNLVLRGGIIDVRAVDALLRSAAASTMRCLAASRVRWSHDGLMKLSNLRLSRLELTDCVADADALVGLKAQLPKLELHCRESGDGPE